MTPDSVFQGDLLRADVFNAGGEAGLFVSFRQRVGTPGTFDTPRPVMGFVNKGFAHVHIQSRWNDWFINDETTAFEDALRALAPRHKYRAALGFSMGGYGALRFAGALRLHRVLVISPQFSIHPGEVPFDGRYSTEAAGFDLALGTLEGRGTRTRGAILVDPFKRRDLGNADLIQTVFKRLRLVRLPCGGHPASRVLTQGGKFGWMKDHLARGLPKPHRIGRMHRKVRRRSPSYWQHLAELAKKHGRDATYDFAMEQFYRLQPAKSAKEQPA